MESYNMILPWNNPELIYTAEWVLNKQKWEPAYAYYLQNIKKRI
jgi:hypothetical protein